MHSRRYIVPTLTLVSQLLAQPVETVRIACVQRNWLCRSYSRDRTATMNVAMVDHENSLGRVVAQPEARSSGRRPGL